MTTPQTQHPAVRLAGPKRIAFGWYGGKFSHLDWLLPLLPACDHYVEPFGGSAAVLLNRAPAKLETYNDLDGEVANFFRVLRNDRAALIEAIGLTPFSRREYEAALRPQEPGLRPVERARRFFVRARQSRTGLAQAASMGRWANCRTVSRSGMSGAVSRWLGSVEGLPEIAERLLRVQIEDRPALEVVRRYDSLGTLTYCDPPYPHSTRGDSRIYAHEFDEAEHGKLADVLRACRGRVAVSGYRCDLMDSLYEGWHRWAGPRRTAHSVKRPRQEFLWTNYPLS
ncbi:MAG: DNA adenine methylase [Thermoplasmata archaeon]|nr:DNA adenine methylase [Thermoplasmata archaeon]